jgi:hypothetical protein
MESVLNEQEKSRILNELKYAVFTGNLRYVSEENEKTALDRGFTLVPNLIRSAKNCNVGISCGGSCISSKKVCSASLPEGMQDKKAALAAAVSTVSTTDRGSYKQLIAAGQSVTDRYVKEGRLGEFSSLYQELQAIGTAALTENLDAKLDKLEVIVEGSGNPQAIKQSIRDFYALTGEMSSETLEAVVISDKRPMASVGGGFIEVGDDRSDIFHEAAHHIEADTDIYLAAKQWRDSRAIGPAKPLAEITGISEYGDEEAVPGNFINPYVGKVYYGEDSTEVVSVGLEHFSNTQAMRTLYQGDREHFDLMVGILATQGQRQRFAGLYSTRSYYRNKPPKPKNCKKGISCGNACISATKTCRKTLDATAKKTKKTLEKIVKKTPPKLNRANYNEMIAVGKEILDGALAKSSSATKIYYNVTNELKDRIKASGFDVEEWVETITYTDAQGNKLSVPEESSFKSVLFDAAILAGTAPSLEKARYDSKSRAFANEDSITVSELNFKSEIFHEFAHHVEDSDFDAAVATRQWRDSRASSDDLVLMRELTGNPNYRDSEVGYRGNYVHPYVGKVYQNSGATEVLSVGFEHLAGPMSFNRLLNQDREHLELILGLIATRTP